MNTISLLSPRKDIAFDVFPFHLLRRDPWSRPRSEDPSGALTRDPFCATPRLQINHNPPYNTGSDFVYRDDFEISQDEYDEQLGMIDEDLNRLFKNTDSNGRFHSDWCSMIYSRLLLCRILLSDDGVIFISIDDHEQENMKKICDEIFGEGNFLAQIVWERAFSPVNL